MSWRISIYFIFLFYYTCNGQNVLVSLKDQLANMASKKTLNLNRGTKDNTSSIKTLKAKRPYEETQMPSQWAQDPEAPYRWAHGAVKYYIDSESYGEGVADLLRMALYLIADITRAGLCPSFKKLDKPGDADGDWLHFTNPDRVRPCVHEPGISRGGEIKIVLGYDCLKPREVLHSVLHGLGFRDEITHPKRDLFVRIMWENIQPAFRSMFRVQSVGAVNDLAEYDPMSIMHFHDRAYSINGQATIAPVLPGLKIEPTDGLSHLDKMKIRRIFGHECKKLQISSILNSCGWNKNLDTDGFPQFTPITDNNAVLCGNRNNQSRIPSDSSTSSEDKMVIPGNDVESESESEGGNEGAVVVPGNDVELEGENKSGNVGAVVLPDNDVEVEGENKSGNVGAIVIPGNDVEVEGENKSGNVGAVVIPGNDVEVEGENEGAVVVPGNDVEPDGEAPKNKHFKLASTKPDSDEAIIVGHDVANKKYMAKNSIGEEKVNNKLLAYKHSAKLGSADSIMPDEEAIVVGYDAESGENKLRRRRRQ